MPTMSPNLMLGNDESMGRAVVVAIVVPYTPAASEVITRLCSPTRPHVYAFGSWEVWIKPVGSAWRSSSIAIIAARSIGKAVMMPIL